MNKFPFRTTPKKVEMRDLVSPTPSKNAVKAVKIALQKSYSDQQAIAKKATLLRSN